MDNIEKVKITIDKMTILIMEEEQTTFELANKKAKSFWFGVMKEISGINKK